MQHPSLRTMMISTTFYDRSINVLENPSMQKGIKSRKNNNVHVIV